MSSCQYRLVTKPHVSALVAAFGSGSGTKAQSRPAAASFRRTTSPATAWKNALSLQRPLKKLATLPSFSERSSGSALRKTSISPSSNGS